MRLWDKVRRWLGGDGDGDGDAGAGADPGSRPGAGESGRAPGVTRPGDAAGPGPSRVQPPHEQKEESGSDIVAKLARAGLPDGPSVEEAIAVLRQARGTIREAEAVFHVLAAIEARAVAEPLRVACADLLAARGDEVAALGLLDGAVSTEALVLAADLHAARGQLARAVGTIERVLARDLDAPGAKERHSRFRAALGFAPQAVRHLDEATIVAPSPAGVPFRLLREVARGGAGAVYEAEDEGLGRRAAFKVYHGRGADRSIVEREARAAAALEGPGVVRVFDADPAEGWVSLEWVARGSVRDVLRSGDLAVLLPIGRWARPLSRALARVHAAGWVHGDVKPANVLLRAPDDPVLGDFGLARPVGSPAAGGSAGYVSPERLVGRASDPRDDVYGYGRVLEDVILRALSGPASGADTRAAEVDPSAAAELDAFRVLALRCIGADEERPADGRELTLGLP